MRVELLNYFQDFYKTSLIEAKKNKRKAIVFGNPKDPVTTYELARIFKRHDIVIHHLKNNILKKGKKIHPRNKLYYSFRTKEK